MIANTTNRIAAAIASRAADGEAGMTTAEYAVGTVAAAGCGGILVEVLTSESMIDRITSVIAKAFSKWF